MDKQTAAYSKGGGCSIQPTASATISYDQHGIHTGGKREQGDSDKAGDERMWIHDDFLVR